MLIGYYEENKCHTEIMGTFLDFYKNENIIVFNDGDTSDYINIFNKFVKFELKSTNEFEQYYDLCNFIIIGSSSNFKYYDKYKQSNKIIAIHHLLEDGQNFKYNNSICLTPINLQITNNYIFPINNFICNNIKKKYDCITIGCIGRFKNNNRDIEDIIKLIKEYNHLNIRIVFFTRHTKFMSNKILKLKDEYKDKIMIYYKFTQDRIIKYLDNIHYLCPFIDDDSIYNKDRLCGLIPFAFNYNIPLLINKQINDLYSLNSPITYNKSITEIIEQLTSFDEIIYNDYVNKMYIEKNKILNINNDKMKFIFDIYRTK